MPDLRLQIIERLPGIVEPTTYFTGTPDVKIPLPANVLIASRFPGKSPSTTRSSHSRFLLIFVLDGRNCEAILDGIRYKIAPGQALLIFPWQHHHFFPGENFKWLYLTFEMQNTTNIEALRNKVSIIPGQTYKYLDALTGIYKGARVGGLAYTSEIILLAALILTTLQSAEKPSPAKTGTRSGEDEIFIDKVNLYIAKNIGTRLTVKELAEKFSLSESHFRALYRKRMGKSIGECIAEARLLKAKQLLAGSDMEITSIASECGFSDIYSFSRFFSNGTDESPRKFRKNYRK